jgi:hypothetical protein
MSPGDFRLFPEMKEPLQGKCQDKTFNAGGISDLPGQLKECVSANAEYLEKVWELGDSGMYILFVKIKVKSRSTWNHPHTVKPVSVGHIWLY